MRVKWLAGAMVACLLPTIGFSPAASATSHVPLPHALVLSASATPAALPPAGGAVTVHGTVGDATSCRLELLSHQFFPVVYASNVRPCTGSFTAQVTIGANNSAVKRTVAFALIASNGSSSFTGHFYVTLGQLPGPVIVSASASPQQLGPSGGTTTVTAVLKNAKTCSLELMSHQSFTVNYATNTRPCTSSLVAHVVIGPNLGTEHKTVAFELTVSDGPSRFSGQFFIGLAGSAVPAAPVTTTTTTPPAPTTTTTTTPPPAPTTTTVPPSPTTTTTPSGSGEGYYTESSPNWSGYGISGGPFTAVQGTFSVPKLAANAECKAVVSEWVGIDGLNASNLPTDTDLIQAGIAESMTNPQTGVCTAGEFWLWPWWEVLPDASVPVPLPMSAGDSITVTIGVLQDGNYGVIMQDNTNGQQFQIEEPYYGTGSSVEWVVEAPVVPGLCGVGEDPSFMDGLCPLAAFEPVVWTNPKLTGTPNAVYQISMVQGGDQVATPSALANNSFTVNYTGLISNHRRIPALVGAGREVTGNFLHPVYEGSPSPN